MLTACTTILALRVLATLIAVANVFVVARLLGPEGTGHYFLFSSLVLALSVFSDIGLSQSAAVFPARDPRSVRSAHRQLVEMLGGGVCLVSILSALAFALAGPRWLPNFAWSWFLLSMLAAPFSAYAVLWTNLAVGLGRARLATAVQVATASVTLTLNVAVLAVVGAEVGAAMSVFAGTLILQSLLMTRLVGTLGADGDLATRTGRSEMFRFGLRGYPGAISTLIWMRGTLFILNYFHGAAAVGVFSLAQQIAEKLLLPAQVLKDVVFREIAAGTRTEATRLTDHILRTSLLVAIPVGIAAGVVIPWLVSVTAGPAYASSADIFRVLVIGSFVTVPAVLLVPFFLGQLEKPGLLSVLAWINVVVSTALALAMVPRWSAPGAAWALLITQIAGVGIVMFVYVRSAPSHARAVVLPNRHDLDSVLSAAARLVGRWTTR